MALSRFILAKPVLHFHTRVFAGIPKSTRWVSSSSSSSSNGGTQKFSHVKGVEGEKENEHLEMHLKVLSRETAEMKMGGSWYSLKSVFTNLKDRMLRNPESYKQISSETTHSTESSEVITTQTGDSKHIAESGGSNNVLKSSEIPTDSSSTEESISTCITSHLQRRHLSEDAVNTTASVVMEMQGSPDDIKHNEHDGTVQVASSIISDNPKEVMLENGKRLLQELASGAIVEPTNNQNKGVGHLIYLADRLFEDAFDTSQNKIVNESASIRNTEFHLEKKTATLVERVKIDGSKLNERPPSSDGLVDLFKMTVSNKTAAEMGSVNGDLSAASESFSNHDGTSLKKVERSFDFSGLIDHIRMLPGVPAQDNAMCAIDNIQSQVELQKSDSESRNTVLKGRAVGKNSKKTGEIKKGQSVKAMTKDEGGNLLIAEKDHIKLEKNPQVPLQTSKKGSNQTVLTCFSEGHTENKVLLRFLHKDVRDSDIISYFRNFGPISKIKKVSSVKGSNFFDAILHFERREGMLRALEKTEFMIRNSSAFVSETSLEDTTNRISIPNLIDDIDIPVALVKHPTRTVKIKQLTHDISSHQLKEALSFCGSDINGFFLGTSGSNAYVELESEDAKERALAKHLIQVSGKQLSIFRVDAPRTTVVRILNINPQCQNNVLSVCKSFGKPMRMKFRDESMVDVYFKIDEWPNMLNILNSLNGLEVDGCRWVAQPAPIFPPIILQALWNHPDERRHVITLMQYLLKKLEHPTDTAELSNLVAKFYGDSL